ncbi:TagK domain-containing protein [Serratia inhibens]|uniref:TagK domain-containing protein n=1 Tax=Serratia inhibens TaxID=2338073 RepID=UPI0011DF99A9|nr:TagK domain-containing protein [Serratia inhibens]
MQLQMDWPRKGLHHRLREFLAPEQADFFCLQQGKFVNEKPEGRQGFLRFCWNAPDCVMVCHSDEYQGVIDFQHLQPGVAYPLRLGMVIQVGHFRFSVTPVSDSTLPLLGDSDLPDLDTLLMHGGHYTPWEAPDLSVIAEQIQGDVLKQLGSEYKRYLLWGDQSRNFISQDVQQENPLPAHDSYLEHVIKSSKNKTLSECIFNEGSLIERVLTELMSLDQAEIIEEKQPDILTALAPEHLSRIERWDVSELLYRELYKLGLDSHL